MPTCSNDEEFAMTIVVTQDKGATAKPVGVLYGEPERQRVDAATPALEESGLDASFVADLLSAALTHERCGVQLYRSVAGRTVSEQLRERYVHFGEETAEHVRLLEELISSSGGDPHYVSPAARATERTAAAVLESTYMLAGSVDLASAELALIEAVVAAEVKDRANWELLAELAALMQDGDVRKQLESVTAEVLEQEQEHFAWAAQARANLLLALATGRPAAEPGGKDDVVIDLREKTRDELYAAAQETGIPGRSQMTKDELVDALAQQEGVTR
jgi:rubrerythrin